MPSRFNIGTPRETPAFRSSRPSVRPEGQPLAISRAEQAQNIDGGHPPAKWIPVGGKSGFENNKSERKI
jgi:hypothetical protein